MIFVINSGSSSLKFSVFDSQLHLIASGKIAQMKKGKTVFILEENGSKIEENQFGFDDKKLWVEKIKDIFYQFCSKEKGESVKIIGHRLVIGGGDNINPMILNEQSLKDFEKSKNLLPLHLPAQVEILRLFLEFFRDYVHVAVFDTSFHNTISEDKRHTGLPVDLEKELSIKKHGYHGLSHESVVHQLYNLNEVIPDRLISCHLGSGSSVAAVLHGKSIATSMGFGPGTGLVMGTRSGDVDWEALLYVMEEKNYSPLVMRKMLYQQSGLLDISGISSLMPELLAQKRNPNVLYAINIFTERVVQTISSYFPALGGIDAIVFTGGIGEGSSFIRSQIIKKLAFLNIKINEENNILLEKNHSFGNISAENSSAQVWTLRSQEELMIAKHALSIMNPF